MVISVKSIVLFILFSISLCTSLIMKTFSTSSMMLGVFLLISMIFILYVLKPIKSNFSKSNAFLFLSTGLWIYIISLISACQQPTFEYFRFFGSYLMIIIFLILAFIFSKYLNKISSSSFSKIINSVFYILIFDGIYSTIKYVFIVKDKETLFFSEPSHYALIVLSFSLYKLLENKKTESSNLTLSITVLSIALFLENLTLLVGILLALFIITKWKNFLFVFLVVAVVLLSAPEINLDYFLSRLTFTGDITNLSTLVFLSGWERAVLNFQETYGLGIGLNQLGYVGPLGSFQEILTSLGMSGLNLYDGGSTGSKVISELGLLGLSLIIIYLYFVWKFYLSIKYIISLDSKDIFFFSIFFMFAIELFIRGVGLFSPTVFLFFISVFYMKNISYTKMKEFKIQKKEEQ